MTHKYNTQVFLAGSETSKKLLDLYCSLVIIELAVKDGLKDKTKTWPQIGHDITTGIQNLFSDPDSDPLFKTDYRKREIIKQLRADAVNLKNDFDNLYCTGGKGESQKAYIQKYPYIRYLQHESDIHNGRPGKTTEQDLENALRTAQNILNHLRKLSLLS
ncbi:MAG: hypothetical protein ACAF42_08130 [Limnothrix sp. BL-A-16]